MSTQQAGRNDADERRMLEWIERQTRGKVVRCERQARWRERQGHPIGLHRGQPLRTRLLMPDAERQLWNFITPAIGSLVASEYAANVKRRGPARKLYGYPRLFDNLLSSQPLAFNLFGELATDLDAATTVCRSVCGALFDAGSRRRATLPIGCRNRPQCPGAHPRAGQPLPCDSDRRARLFSSTS